MSKLRIGLLMTVALVAAIGVGRYGRDVIAQSGAAAAPQRPSPQVPDSPLYNIIPPAAAVFKSEDGLLQWPLPASEQQYGAIDGKRMHGYVVEQSMISRRYRDAGHPLYWGRPIGSTADAESAQWLADKFTKIGLADVKIQELPIPTP